MKSPASRLIRLSAGFLSLVFAATQAPQSRGDPAPAVPAALSPLDQITGPIALYPDPLIALILPASAVPSDLAAAAAYLTGGGDPTVIDVQPWDPSVRGLAHYPSVLEWMAENPDWTAALGAAFANNPADVMNSIQHLRTIARDAGTLANTPQQDVIDEDGSLAIVPADPNAIYVPSYDPEVVYVDGPYYGYAGPFLTFGVGCPVGAWLSYGFDWGHHALWVGDWRNWHSAQGWAHPILPGQRGFIGGPTAHAWSPSARRSAANGSFSARSQTQRAPSRSGAVARPTPIRGAPPPPEPRHPARSAWASPRSVPVPSSPAPRPEFTTSAHHSAADEASLPRPEHQAAPTRPVSPPAHSVPVHAAAPRANPSPAFRDQPPARSAHPSPSSLHPSARPAVQPNRAKPAPPVHRPPPPPDDKKPS